MDFSPEIEPIVSRDEILRSAREAAERGKSVHDNPYPQGTQAHALYERYFWAREVELCGDETA